MTLFIFNTNIFAIIEESSGCDTVYIKYYRMNIVKENSWCNGVLLLLLKCIQLVGRPKNKLYTNEWDKENICQFSDILSRIRMKSIKYNLLKFIYHIKITIELSPIKPSRIVKSI